MNTTTNFVLRGFLLIALVGCHSFANAQNPEPLETSLLEKAYEHFKESQLTERRFGYDKISPLIESRSDVFQQQVLGKSVEGRPLHALTYGSGPIPVLLWSQMHGDESTATMALFDLLNFLEGSEADDFAAIRKVLQENLTIRFIPMVNPDGAERFQRRNALHIDLNRDAIRQSSPEAIILKAARDDFEPAFGFNLHDQNAYYNASGTSNPATISVLAPAYNEAREVNEGREEAMKVIVGMNRVLQEEIPGNVGKYNDSFEPRAFGDNFQKWGTSTILIESGAYPNDPEKQYIRKLNFMIILNALYEIATGIYDNHEASAYQAIPDNASRLMDLLIKNVRSETNGYAYVTDIGIRRSVRYQNGARYEHGEVEDWGDLSIYYGYEELDAEGMTVAKGKVWGKEVALEEISKDEVMGLLREGYLAIKTPEENKGMVHDLPILILTGDQLPDLEPSLSNAPNFFLKNDNEFLYAVINGNLVDLQSPGNKSFKQRVQ
ncbi:M14 family metallopeptidase [Cyclobacterium jeungdonense]|uniref:M14 family zinc carboxypeptidase n=1 Tax=Cyclobacterium jeungdonense TaxID=708087 RepID=A0ABT8C536_9BACT|nr:M14 metallopeptidase family protein [Cyclobacterium jeungdonense]MDN3687874.1 M14 family zinc carboxypeptidase [Cyclobacterium jeungdonense]